MAIKRIEREIIWNGRKNGGTWFHPRAGRLPDGSILMTCQNIIGSDNFGQVHWSKTTDNGVSWSKPQPVAAFARREIGNGFEEGVCDVVPEYHAPTGKMLAMGHNVFYKNDGHYPYPPPGWKGRHSVYSVSDGNGAWSPRRVLEWDDPRAVGYRSCGCAQRYTLENGDVLVPLYYSRETHTGYAVTTVRCSFDGELLQLEEVGRELRLDVNRGLQEPSLTRFGDVFYLTIRAEDDHGYFATSTDGLKWGEMVPWMFDDDEVLMMSTTQQRWLTHSDALFLVYTRRTEDNRDIFRWRSPLFVAQVDMQKQRLIRSTEQIVLDGEQLGNFHVTNVSPEESWITVGEAVVADWGGDTLLARIHWGTPNTLIS